MAEAAAAAWRGRVAGSPADRSAPRTSRTRHMAIATLARCDCRNALKRRTGAAVLEPPRLCAAHLVRSVRPQDDVQPMLGVAGGAPLSSQARLPSLRRADGAATHLPAMPHTGELH